MIPVLVCYFDARFLPHNLENDRCVILVGVGIGIARVFELNDITRGELPRFANECVVPMAYPRLGV